MRLRIDNEDYKILMFGLFGLLLLNLATGLFCNIYRDSDAKAGKSK